jgi:hypothetical protein
VLKGKVMMERVQDGVWRQNDDGEGAGQCLGAE